MDAILAHLYKSLCSRLVYLLPLQMFNNYHKNNIIKLPYLVRFLTKSKFSKVYDLKAYIINKYRFYYHVVVNSSNNYKFFCHLTSKTLYVCRQIRFLQTFADFTTSINMLHLLFEYCLLRRT